MGFGRTGAAVALAIAVLSCGGEDAQLATPPEPPPPEGHIPAGWAPGVAVQNPRDPDPRGWIHRRGLIHAHSVYSHDACDGEPRDEETDAINEPCFDDFRRDLCASKHDFVMLSDHRDSFTRTEYPDTLLYRADRGDTLVERDGGPVANWAACEAELRRWVLGNVTMVRGYAAVAGYYTCDDCCHMPMLNEYGPAEYEASAPRERCGRSAKAAGSLTRIPPLFLSSLPCRSGSLRLSKHRALGMRVEIVRQRNNGTNRLQPMLGNTTERRT